MSFKLREERDDENGDHVLHVEVHETVILDDDEDDGVNVFREGHDPPYSADISQNLKYGTFSVGDKVHHNETGFDKGRARHRGSTSLHDELWQDFTIVKKPILFRMEC